MEEPRTIADAFRSARKNGRALKEFPGALPESLAAAYRIQELEIESLGRVTGWKIAVIKPELRARYGEERLAGPIVRLIEGGTERVRAEIPVIVDGLAAVEAEFALRIGEDLPIRSTPYSEAELADAVASCHTAVEVAGSPLAILSDLGPTAVAADHGNNISVIVGGEIVDWQQRPLDSLTARMLIDGKMVGEGSAARLNGGPLRALAYLVDHLASRGRCLRAGEWVSTGATTGMHKIAPGSAAVADFGSAGQVSLRIVAQPEL